MDTELRQAHALLAKGRVAESAKIAQALVARYPRHPHGWHLLSCIYLRVRQAAEALACSERSVALAPADLPALLQHGLCLIATGRRREALEIADKATNATLNRADLNDTLGTLLTFCEEPKRAHAFFVRAVELAPEDSNFLYNLATAQRMIGDFGAAERTLNRVIAIRPFDIMAYYTRADLRTQTTAANHIQEMTRLLQRGGWAPADEILLCFGIAKELEDICNYRLSFQYLKRACDLQRRLMKYDVLQDVGVIDQLIEVYDRGVVDVGGGFETTECIFVIGLPRSGTTLVESILASHSSVQAAGELQAFPSETLRAVQSLGSTPLQQVDLYRQARFADPASLGRAYVAATRPQTGKAAHFVDKQPINCLYAGLIRRALPRARIVALARDPMDSCYAMYKTAFVGAYPFSYELSELGQYYVAWHRLMRHWKDVIGDNLLIVQYEDLVTHQEQVSRRILEHCGLEWQPACLAFHERKTAVTTASASQVRRAMYSSSVGKWRHFEAELRPLADVLKLNEPADGWRLA